MLGSMRSLIALTALALGACTAETFSPSATYTVAVIGGAVSPSVAPGEEIADVILQVLDDRGNPVVGREVAAKVWEGDGSAILNATTSGSDGLLHLSWTAGPMPGTQRLHLTPFGGEGLTLTAEATGFQATKLSVGLFNVCAIDLDARAWCWGDGLSDGAARGDSGIDVLPDWRPIRVAGGHQFAEIAAGGTVACALDLAGAAWCWGLDQRGQLGQGVAATGLCYTLPCQRFPVEVVGGHRFTAIAAIASTVCAIDGAKQVWCWGENSSGEVGIGAGSPSFIRTPTQALVSDSVEEIFAGYSYFCARMATGVIECWGENSPVRQGASPGSDGRRPTPVATTERFTRAWATPDGMCGRKSSGETYCWGQVGGPSAAVTRRPELDGFSVLGGDWLGTGWGLDGTGRLHRFYQGTSTDVSGGVRLSSIRSGAESGCGLGGGGQVWCWGSNTEGELGNGSVPAVFDAWHYPPVPVGGWYPLP